MFKEGNSSVPSPLSMWTQAHENYYVAFKIYFAACLHFWPILTLLGFLVSFLILLLYNSKEEEEETILHPPTWLGESLSPAEQNGT